MGRGAQGDAVLDQRIGWLLQQIRIAYKHVTPDMCSGFVDLTVSFPTDSSGSGGTANTGAHVWASHRDRSEQTINREI